MQTSTESALPSYVQRLEQTLEKVLFCTTALADHPEMAGWLVRDALEKDDRTRAESLVAQTEDLSAAWPGKRSLAIAAAHVRGLLDRDPTQLETAAAGYSELADVAAAYEDAAVAWDERGQTKRAVAQLNQAAARYAAVGAQVDLARVEARLRVLRSRPAELRGRRPSFGWKSLSATERRVLALVAEGLTNRQVAKQLFLSRHTVDFHLRQIFRKLGVTSRVQLTRLWLEHSVADR